MIIEEEIKADRIIISWWEDKGRLEITKILGKIPNKGGMPPMDKILNKINILVNLLETMGGIELT